MPVKYHNKILFVSILRIIFERFYIVFYTRSQGNRDFAIPDAVIKENSKTETLDFKLLARLG